MDIPPRSAGAARRPRARRPCYLEPSAALTIKAPDALRRARLALFSAPMAHYDFAPTFRALYDKAVALYANGNRQPDNYFTGSEREWLAANGITAQHLYDYAEDELDGGEPGHGNALGIELVRRDYFLNVQEGRPSAVVLDEDSLPPKDATVAGISWLPRIIPKAKAKLRGELPPSLMYCCGGDRNFLRTHDIQPAEFLSLIWRNLDDDDAVITWVQQRSAVQRKTAGVH
jgi:hypothetical protein